ncbi:hypothetical protein AAHE18_19G098500 [Arachis hypogaea]
MLIRKLLMMTFTILFEQLLYLLKQDQSCTNGKGFQAFSSEHFSKSNLFFFTYISKLSQNFIDLPMS